MTDMPHSSFFLAVVVDVFRLLENDAHSNVMRDAPFLQVDNGDLPTQQRRSLLNGNHVSLFPHSTPSKTRRSTRKTPL